SFNNGPRSAINVGAFIGMCPNELLNLVLAGFPFGSFTQLWGYMANTERLSKMDFALIRLLNLECEHVLIGNHDGGSYITTWPV
ncbi:hypothetical protein R3P38DRAFT_2381976, partial [Favolaschia claudopus]